MNGIENIIARIEADAQKACEDIRSESARQAEAIGADYRAQAEQAAAEVLERGRQQAQLQEERLVNAARLEQKKELLAAKQALVEEAFLRAQAQLAALPEQQRIDLLARLAASASVTGREQLIFSDADRASIGAQVVEKANRLCSSALTLAEETRRMAGGVILKDARIETNCSFEALLHQKREQLTAQVAETLFA